MCPRRKPKPRSLTAFRWCCFLRRRQAETGQTSAAAVLVRTTSSEKLPGPARTAPRRARCPQMTPTLIQMVCLWRGAHEAGFPTILAPDRRVDEVRWRLMGPPPSSVARCDYQGRPLLVSPFNCRRLERALADVPFLSDRAPVQLIRVIFGGVRASQLSAGPHLLLDSGRIGNFPRPRRVELSVWSLGTPNSSGLAQPRGPISRVRTERVYIRPSEAHRVRLSGSW